MANTIYNPGMKDSFQDVSNILNLWGQSEYERQKRTAVEDLVTAMAKGDTAKIDAAVQRVSGTAKYDTGLSGMLQKFSTPFMRGSPVSGAVSETMPVAKGMADIGESQARSAYYKGMADIGESQARSAYYKGGGRQTAQPRSTAAELADFESTRAQRIASIERSNSAARRADPNAKIIDPFSDPLVKSIDAQMQALLNPGGAAAPTGQVVSQQGTDTEQIPRGAVGNGITGNLGNIVSQGAAPQANASKQYAGLSKETTDILNSQSDVDRERTLGLIRKHGEDKFLNAIREETGAR